MVFVRFIELSYAAVTILPKWWINLTPSHISPCTLTIFTGFEIGQNCNRNLKRSHVVNSETVHLKWLLNIETVCSFEPIEKYFVLWMKSWFFVTPEFLLIEWQQNHGVSGVCKNIVLHYFSLETVQIWLNWTWKVFFSGDLLIMSKVTNK